MMNRRDLLKILPAAGMAGMVSRGDAAPIPAAAMAGGKLAISVQCWSFKQFTLFEALGMAGAAGATVVELFPGQKLGGTFGDLKCGPDLPEEAVAALKAQAATSGVSLANFGVTPIPAEIEKARAFFDFAKKLGLYGLTTESIESIDTLEALAKEYDVKVGFHNHPKRPNYKMWDPDFVFSQVKDRDPRIGICADTGHWATSGMDAAGVVRKVASRVVSFHLKDRESIEKWSHDRPFGTGVVDLKGMLDAVKPHGFAGNVSIEYEHNWDKSLPEVAQCAGWLRAYAGFVS